MNAALGDLEYTNTAFANFQTGRTEISLVRNQYSSPSVINLTVQGAKKQTLGYTTFEDMLWVNDTQVYIDSNNYQHSFKIDLEKPDIIEFRVRRGYPNAGFWRPRTTGLLSLCSSGRHH